MSRPIEYDGGSLVRPDYGALIDGQTGSELVTFHEACFDPEDRMFRPEVVAALRQLLASIDDN